MPRKQWNRQNTNVRVDYWVIIADTNAVRGNWQNERVTRVFPGDDGLIRNVEAKTTTVNYRRPITKLSAIYPVEGFKD